jgi:hypothetical protein
MAIDNKPPKRWLCDLRLRGRPMMKLERFSAEVKLISGKAVIRRMSAGETTTGT